VGGSTTIAAGAATQRVAVQQLDPSRSFLVFGTRFDSAAPADIEITGQITSPTELTFARASTANSPAAPVYYYVAEFQSGVLVQRGAATLSATTANAPLSAVNLTKTFPIVTYRNTGTSAGRDDFVRGKLTSSTQLSIVDNLAAPNGVAEWQVVTFEGATVQSGDIALSEDTNTYTATVQPVDRANTWPRPIDFHARDHEPDPAFARARRRDRRVGHDGRLVRGDVPVTPTTHRARTQRRVAGMSIFMNLSG
jgi:hypothetical protein